jgi:membrane-bound lytic murein transglycosylase A
MTHMTSALRSAHALAAATILGIGLGLAGCSNTAPPAPGEPMQPVRRTPAAPPAATPPPAAPPAAPVDGPEPTAVERARARWVPVAWSDLPGWADDRIAEFWPALLRSCERPAAGWQALCADARRTGGTIGDAALRQWLQQRLQPHRVESLERDPVGLATGYFEPLIAASRSPRPGFRVALHAPPPDLAAKKPYWSRRELETLAPARDGLRGSEIAWVPDRLDALILQIQGSGRLAFAAAEPGGRPAVVRVAYAGHNDQPYKSVGRWLIDAGELRPGEASWPAIRDWARRHPSRVDEMLWSNPRVVFFREEPLPDPGIGPKGAQGVPLTPGRSIAVDPLSVPYGTPVWLDTTEPLSATPLRRLVMAQDTGSAITGAVRADYFWGWGDAAEAQAGRMKQALRMWVLWPVR